jgi:hypothetical protein
LRNQTIATLLREAWASPAIKTRVIPNEVRDLTKAD